MKRRDCLRLAATAGVGATGCISALDEGPGSENAYLAPPSEQLNDVGFPTYGEPVPDAELPDVFTGETVSTAQDEEYLMTFFYSFCPTECIWIISAVTHAEERVIELDGEPPRILAATFDPARDTEERLLDYADRMGIDRDSSNWSILCPDGEERAREVVDERFGVSFEKRSTGGVYDFIHTTLILLVNKDGYVERTYLNDDPDPDLIASNLVDLREAQKG